MLRRHGQHHNRQGSEFNGISKYAILAFDFSIVLPTGRYFRNLLVLPRSKSPVYLI